MNPLPSTRKGTKGGFFGTVYARQPARQAGFFVPQAVSLGTGTNERTIAKREQIVSDFDTKLTTPSTRRRQLLIIQKAYPQLYSISRLCVIWLDKYGYK